MTCIILSLMITSIFGQFLLVVLIFCLIYSLIILLIYRCLMMNRFDEIKSDWVVRNVLSLFFGKWSYVLMMMSLSIVINMSNTDEMI